MKRFVLVLVTMVVAMFLLAGTALAGGASAPEPPTSLEATAIAPLWYKVTWADNGFGYDFQGVEISISHPTSPAYYEFRGYVREAELKLAPGVNELEIRFWNGLGLSLPTTMSVDVPTPPMTFINPKVWITAPKKVAYGKKLTVVADLSHSAKGRMRIARLHKVDGKWHRHSTKSVPVDLGYSAYSFRPAKGTWKFQASYSGYVDTETYETYRGGRSRWTYVTVK